MSKWELGKGQFPAFKKRMDNIVPFLMKMGIIEAYRRVTMKTPVDTGRARWGWYCSIGDVSYIFPPEGNYPAADTGRAMKVFAKVDPEDVLYIANSVPYIKRLNEGFSKQAPARFVEMTLQEVVGVLHTYIIKQGWQARIE